MCFFIELIKKIFRKIKKILGHKARPVLHNARPDDVWLVSFPRSGNTWLNFLLANLMVKYCRKSVDFNIRTVHDIVPDIHYNKENIPEDLGFYPFPRIIKSHAGYLPDYKRVIYIVRDPRDVMVSYYDYLTKKINGPNFKNFSDFIKNRKYGLPAWCKHLKSWMNKWDIIIKYEDLKENSYTQLKRILSFLKLDDIVDGDIELAIEKSSFENMQLKEKREGFEGSKTFSKNFVFVRQGKVGGWKDVFSSHDLRYYIKQASKYKLKLFLKRNNYF